jgi:peptide/nickel transport system substrate-binding protein
MIRQIIAHFSVKERIVFVLSIFAFLVGIFSGLVTLSNHFATVVPQHGGSYKEGIIGSPRFINPILATSDADRDLTTLIYSGLVRTGENGAIIPDLAESWEVSTDGKTYTVHLKPKTSFHDGKKITANDVVFTVGKISDPILKSPLRVAWDGVSATAVDDQTVLFTLQKPYAGFLSQLTLGILPEHIWKNIPDESWQLSKYNTEPIGSGPYKMDTVTRNRIGIPETYTLSSFKKFVLGRPFINKIIIECLSNKSDAYTAFKNNNLDGISGVDAKDAEQIVENSTTVITGSLPRIFGIFFNQNKNKIFSDPTVIRALNLAVDRSAVINTVFAGYAHPLQGPLPQSVKTTNTDYETQKALAIKTLEAAGWKTNPQTGLREKTVGKEKLTLTFSLSTANTSELEESAKLIADMYAAIGVHVDIKVFEIGTLNENVIRGRDFQALLFGQIIRHDTDIYAFWHSSQKTDPGLNITGYTNKRVDNLLESAIKETNTEKRQDLYTIITQELAKDAPVAFLYAPDFIYLVNKGIHNIVMPPITDTDDRFSLIYQWYARTDHVWNGLVQ